MNIPIRSSPVLDSACLKILPQKYFPAPYIAAGRCRRSDHSNSWRISWRKTPLYPVVLSRSTDRSREGSGEPQTALSRSPACGLEESAGPLQQNWISSQMCFESFSRHSSLSRRRSTLLCRGAISQSLIHTVERLPVLRNDVRDR